MKIYGPIDIEGHKGNEDQIKCHTHQLTYYTVPAIDVVRSIFFVCLFYSKRWSILCLGHCTSISSGSSKPNKPKKNNRMF